MKLISINSLVDHIQGSSNHLLPCCRKVEGKRLAMNTSSNSNQQLSNEDFPRSVADMKRRFKKLLNQKQKREDMECKFEKLLIVDEREEKQKTEKVQGEEEENKENSKGGKKKRKQAEEEETNSLSHTNLESKLANMKLQADDQLKLRGSPRWDMHAKQSFQGFMQAHNCERELNRIVKDLEARIVSGKHQSFWARLNEPGKDRQEFFR
jgi:hypothetical protein